MKRLASPRFSLWIWMGPLWSYLTLFFLYQLGLKLATDPKHPGLQDDKRRQKIWGLCSCFWSEKYVGINLILWGLTPGFSSRLSTLTVICCSFHQWMKLVCWSTNITISHKSAISLFWTCLCFLSRLTAKSVSKYSLYACTGKIE